METIDIGRELQDIMASEELLAFFDFVLPLATAARDRGAVQGVAAALTALEIDLPVDLPDHRPAGRRRLPRRRGAPEGGRLERGRRGGCPGIDCFVAIPHRSHQGGLFLKEVDVYLDGSRPPDVAFVRDVLQPAIARAVGLRPGELTVWEESAAAPPADRAPEGHGTSLLDRFRRLGSRVE